MPKKFPERVNKVSAQDIGERANAKICREILLSRIHENPDNSKIFSMNAVDALANEIKNYGFVGSIQVVDLENGEYEIVAGHQRVAAAKKVGMTTISAEVLNLNETQKRNYLIKSNLLVRNISSIEFARMLEYHEETLRKENNYRASDYNEKIMKEFNIGKTGLARYKNLLKCDDSIQNIIEKYDLAFRPFVDLKIYEIAEEKQKKIAEALQELYRNTEDLDFSATVLEKVVNSVLSSEEKPQKKEKEVLNECIDKKLKSVLKNLTKLNDESVQIEDKETVATYLDELERQINDIRKKM